MSPRRRKDNVLKYLLVTLVCGYLAGYATAQSNWRGVIGCGIGLIAIAYVMAVAESEQG
jgi:hypothetical protein